MKSFKYGLFYFAKNLSFFGVIESAESLHLERVVRLHRLTQQLAAHRVASPKFILSHGKVYHVQINRCHTTLSDFMRQCLSLGCWSFTKQNKLPQSTNINVEQPAQTPRGMYQTRELFETSRPPQMLRLLQNLRLIFLKLRENLMEFT